MLKENQLSTIALLILVGFVIYKLMLPGTIKNTGAVEDSEDVLVVSEEEEEPQMMESEEEEEPQMMESEEEEPQMMEEEEEEDSEMEMIPEEIAYTEMEEESNQVNSFTANDEGDEGAGLDEAFQKPIGKQTSVDKVNFNKNIVNKYDATQYLPKEVNDEWFETDFQQAKYKAGSDKMINTERYIIGVNTVGQSLKNPAYDIRGTIPNPKYSVSPWNNSTYEADYNLKPLC